MNKNHPFHIVDVSPWPICTAIAVLYVTVGVAMYMHSYTNGLLLLAIGLTFLIFTVSTWWSDVVREATYQGHHTQAVQHGLAIGVALFIVSEVMFFFGFFWAFFDVSLAPGMEMGAAWPPTGLSVLDPWKIPLVNTVILLVSGVTLTCAHYNMVFGDSRGKVLFFLASTVFLGVIFTVFQLYEYLAAPFSMHDSVYGSTFFLLTGFHGLHVLIGTIFIIVATVSFLFHHFTTGHHIGLEAAAWYWHFVDVVWLFLFIFVYVWATEGVDFSYAPYV